LACTCLASAVAWSIWLASPTLASPFEALGDEAFTWIEITNDSAGVNEPGSEVTATTERPPMFRLPAVEDIVAIEPVEAEAEAEVASEIVEDEPSDEMLAAMQNAWIEVAPVSSQPSPATSHPSPVTNHQSPVTTSPQPYAPTVAELSKELLPSVQRAYGLAKHGAIFAAQTEFIQVLRRIAQAKDAAAGSDAHARSLAAGLRALDEADDFMPHGAELEAEVNVMVIASAHRTPVLAETDSPPRPDEAVARYHEFARRELARAVAGEQAGSMALYGLGKVQNRVAKDDGGELRHERRALTMFQAALDSGPGNHFAANEIGVLLARGGRSVDAAMMFRRAIDLEPSATNYHNLAVVERKLGYHEYAAANAHYAQQLAHRDRAAGANSLARNVQWVNPQDLTRVTSAQPNSPPPPATPPMQPPAAPATGPASTVAKWPQKLVPGVFRR
jgi:tetratricopeptide (TPR) repeat protein